MSVNWVEALFQVFKISRPRFWVYLAGPFAVGAAFSLQAKTEFLTFQFLYPLFFFLIPANILLYGINDIYDQDTDVLNSKKAAKEGRLTKSNARIYGVSILVAFILSIPLFVMFNDKARILLILFLILSAIYSLPPIRLKAIPILDFSSNILYGIPAFVAYAFYADKFPHPIVILIIFCWTGAMHLFSAIPDIAPDKKAGIRTSAVVFGKEKSLYICLVLWSITAFVASYLDPFFLISFIYPFIPVYILSWNIRNLSKIYWLFPYINGVLGFFLFWYYAIRFVF